VGASVSKEVEVQAKTIATVMCVVCFMCWPVGEQYAEDTAETKANGYEVSWWNVGSGGGTSTGGSYELVATVGQPGTGESAGGSYFLMGGFMTFAVKPLSVEIFSDGFESGDTLIWSATIGL
jgi:hypothetical protein